VARRILSATLAGAAVVGCLAIARTPEGGPRVTVLVAARDLPTGHELRPTDLVVQSRPSGYAPSTPLPAGGEVSGRQLAAPVGAGEVLTAARLVGAGLLDGQPAGTRAVHVPVADPGALAMVRPGDTVDLVASTGDTVAAAVTVLTVDAGSGAGAGGFTGLAGGVGGLVAAVTPDQARRLAGAPPDELGGSSVTVVLRASPSLR
jgi:Flp pilus assembly protein CpaB